LVVGCLSLLRSKQVLVILLLLLLLLLCEV
jgi:hypothetical protein